MIGAFVTFHGIDGVGKTTCAIRTVERLLASGIDANMWCDYARVRNIEAPSSRGDFPASVTKKILESQLIDRALSEGTTIVKDRWYIDVLASHAFTGDNEGELESSIRKPDLSVILTCEESVRMNDRILARGNPTPEDLIPKEQGTRAWFFEQYLVKNIGNLSLNYMIIDTTSLTPQEVAVMVGKQL